MDAGLAIRREAQHAYCSCARAVFTALRAVPANEIFLFRTLIAIRRCGGSGPETESDAQRPLLDVAVETTFITLSDEPPRKLVLGTIVASPKRNGAAVTLDPALFRPPLPKEVAVAAMNFLVTPDEGGGSTVSTETRVFADSNSTARRFPIYWRIIRPGSDIIRRS